MSRKAQEWIGKTDDTRVPPRVKLRVRGRYEGRCGLCGNREIFGAIDHIIALINGGENRESNLQPLCLPCHAQKTKKDVAEKSKVARIAKKHLGLAKPKANRWPTSRDKPFKSKIGGGVERR